MIGFSHLQAGAVVVELGVIAAVQLVNFLRGLR